ncbi:hypothetical protein [Palleronia sp. LCG004]|uniref:hypothetical protein n=1 Tax=Palleronia sp. LCG004 TaxID=3079304 RepID=UPI0029431344|nr:hypothetical protein [Palleronia sp. LCG004]WOI57002.1 hypothetical protein RVY76_04220 [Palleronia sp. LCG004]
MISKLPVLSLATGLAVAVAAQAQDAAPLSAIDWLSDSVAIPVALPAVPSHPTEPPVASDARPDEVTVIPLEELNEDAVGLFPAASRGLPTDLWSGSGSDVLAISRAPHLKATQDLLHDLFAAEAKAPAGQSENAFLLARIDALINVGALSTARALLDLSGREEPRSFRRWFDIALLTGQENGACSAMRRLPQVTPTYPARVFCLARSGDWRAAALTLETGTSLGVIGKAEAERLRLFLDPEAGPAMLPPPATPSPLDFAIHAATGEPLRSTDLPIAFAHADLRPMNGWKARLDAGERLARAGAIPTARLWDIYHESRPAASGGVWDRVAAVQTLDTAIEEQDADAIEMALPKAWEAMNEAGLAPQLAERHAAALNNLGLDMAADGVAGKLGGLLGIAALSWPETDLGEAIRAGLETTEISASDRAMIDEGRIGEVALAAIARLDEGVEGNLDAIRAGLSLLREAGLEDRAETAARELAILGPGT